jgi:hypothetical protein
VPAEPLTPTLIATLFSGFIVLHIAFGSVGLLAFWVPVIGRKGATAHRQWGRLFTWTMIITGFAAIAVSTLTLIDPMSTHPHLENPAWIRGVFGWMMQGLALLTVNLAWYGWLCVQHKTDRQAFFEWRNVSLQIALTVVSLHCAWQAWLIREPIMLGMPAIGLATVATNLWFMLNRRPAPMDWLKEHIKALVGAGISVYTAFFAFGAVRTLPQLALHPGLWAIPLAVGLSLIIYHRHVVGRYAR